MWKASYMKLGIKTIIEKVAPLVMFLYPAKELGLVEGREDDLMKKGRFWIPGENWEAILTKSHKPNKYTL